MSPWEGGHLEEGEGDLGQADGGRGRICVMFVVRIVNNHYL